MHFILQYLGFVNLGNGGAFVPMETKRETVMDTCVVVVVFYFSLYSNSVNLCGFI